MSGVIVATKTKSISDKAIPDDFMARSAARQASSLVGWSSRAILRDLIPVRVRIHSSEVSTRLQSSSLSTD